LNLFAWNCPDFFGFFALGLYRGQHEYDETVTFTFSVVEYETACDALLGAMRGFSVAPDCHIRRSAMALADIFLMPFGDG
jgi:hypothetical protein